jgi:hypothetical protein
VAAPATSPTATPDYDLIYYERAWQARVDNGFTDEPCPVVAAPVYPDDYYQGRIIDTHMHMPQLPDTPLGFEAGERELEGFARSDYSARDDFDEPLESFPFVDQIPVAGNNMTMNHIACTLMADGTDGGFSFYSVFTSQPDSSLDLAKIAEERWPGLFVPFISPPGEVNNVATVGGARLQEMITPYPGLFKGLGEMRFNGTGRDWATALSHDELMSTLPVVQEHGMMVYTHPDDLQRGALGRTLAANPNTIIIAHGDEIEHDVTQLMDDYPNFYYTIDALFGDQYLQHPEETAAGYLSKTEVEDFPWMLEYDLNFWKEAIEAHPDRFMWGTDRGGIVLWGWDLANSRRVVEYARAFIGQLDPAVQERFAYQNAERLIQAAALP